MIINAYSMENFFLYRMAKKSYEKYNNVKFNKIRDHIKDSDTVVILGTGRSILDITREQWKELSKYNSIAIGSFAQFNKFITIDINHFREIGSYNFIYKNSRMSNWLEMVEYAENINKSAFSQNTIHLFQNGIRANASNRFIYCELLNFNTKYSTYTSSRRYSGKLSEKFGTLSHMNGSLGEAINVAYQLKWNKIILVGIDLNDRQYFYLKENETAIWDSCRKKNSKARHNMADSTIKYIDSIKSQLEHNNIELYIQNPNSLLSPTLPLFEEKK